MSSIKLRIKTFFLPAPTACSITGRIEHYLKNTSVLELTKSSSSTFDEVMLDCARSCGISPLFLPLFGLKELSGGHWIKPSTRISSYEFCSNGQSTTEATVSLEFRIRFTVRNITQDGNTNRKARRYTVNENDYNAVMDDKVLQYLFCQKREDYLKDDFTVKTSVEDPLGSALGVAVLDMLRLACHLKIDAGELQQYISYKKLLPIASQNEIANMNVFNRWRTKAKVFHFLSHFESKCCGQSISLFYLKYLQNLELVVEEKYSEVFKLVPQSEFSCDYSHLMVDSDKGIIRCKDGEMHGEVWCDFHQLSDMSLQVCRDSNLDRTMYIVSLSQLSGTYQRFFLPSIQEAEDLASCIDGYYRVLVDAHHYLCKDISSPMLVEQLALCCHGPISCGFAEQILKTEANLRSGDCLLRCSLESYDEYYINTIEIAGVDVTVKNYKIDRIDGKFGIHGDDQSHRYQSLQHLVEACKTGQLEEQLLPFNLNHLISPQVNLKCNLLIQRGCDNDSKIKGGAMSSSLRTIVIMQQDYMFVKDLGRGSFSKASLYCKQDQPDHKIVVKKVLDLTRRHDLGQKQHIDASFQESVCDFNCLNTLHIVHLLGTMGNMLVLEHVPLGSITVYLEESSLQPSTEWYLNVMWQLTHACSYLEEIGCPHGKISGKNVLLWHDYPNPLVKLSDPGVRTCLKMRQIDSQPVLPAPWLAYEFCCVEQPPAFFKPNIPGDKWSFATTVCEICSGVTYTSFSACHLSREMKEAYMKENIVPIPEMISSLGIGEVCSLIKQCWSKFPYQRPAFRHILRELRTVLSSDYVLPPVRPTGRAMTSRGVETAELDNEHLKEYNIQHLQLLKMLGEGNFGQVKLYNYSANGRSELVAVKTMHHRHNISIIENEIKSMSKVNNKYVVKVKGYTVPTLGIVMEYLKYDPLSKYLADKRQDNVPISVLIPTLVVMSSQIAQGMMALQERRILHRDLALRNILLDQTTSSSPPFIKISDFGLSRDLTENHDYYLSNPTECTPQWYAPECIRTDGKRSYHFESDIWSYGVTIWEMFSYGRKPHYPALEGRNHNFQGLFAILRRGDRLLRPDDCPLPVYELMFRCWEFDYQKRISFVQLKTQFDMLTSHSN